MSNFAEIAAQWRIADDAFEHVRQAAVTADDDSAFDTADDQRFRNNQAYFLYLFSRFEENVTRAVKIIVDNKLAHSDWSEKRIWAAWSSFVLKGDRSTNFMSQIEVLIDKSRADYATIKAHYDGRNKIAHGGLHEDVFVIPEVATEMARIVATFPAL